MKNKVLFYLENSNHEYVSGADIAKTLGISRMSVSKAVSELRAEGAVIESSTKCGYKLIKGPDTLYAEAVKAHTKHRAVVYCHRCIGSTNEEAKKLAADGASHGTVVISEEQTNGRGRRGRSFHSPAGTGLYMSIILRPEMLGDEVMYTVAAAVAVREVIARYNARASIKWVNDIYIEKKKVCGILCEAISDLESGSVSAVICGIGINLTSPRGGFPDELKDKAGALDNDNISRAKISAEVIDSLLDVLEHTPDKLIEQYSNHMMLTGKEIYYARGSESLRATVVGVDGTGGLIVRCDGGVCEILRSGEVQLEKF